MRLKARYITLIMAGFAIPVAMAAVRTAVLPVVEIRWPTRIAQLPPDTLQEGTELALVYIGSSTCVWCQSEELPGYIDNIRMSLAERASQLRSGFVAIGVSVDTDVERGLRHLREIGPFHEVSTGRRWLNIGALKYVWNEYRGRLATPQILVIRRTITRGQSQSVSRGELLVRRIGLGAIGSWSSAGAPVPIGESD